MPRPRAPLAGSLATRWASAAAAWAAFERAPPSAIGVDDIPWPDFGLLRQVVTESPAHVDFAVLVGRWQPDAFRARFAKGLAASGPDKLRVMRRVGEVSALMNAARLRALAASSGAAAGEEDESRFYRADDAVFD
jgi:hypothetical protein